MNLLQQDFTQQQHDRYFLKPFKNTAKKKFTKLYTHHTIFKSSEVTLLPCISEEFDVSVCLTQSVSWVAGVGHLLGGGGTMQSQKTHLDHVSTWIVKLIGKE